MRLGQPVSHPVVGAIRWATLTLGLLLAATWGSPGSAAYGGVLLAHALWRTARPGRADRVDVVPTVMEVVLHLVVVGSTGGWRSPFVVTLIGPLAAIARARAVQRYATEREVHALGQLARLGEANVLLTALHDVAKTLPVSLDLDTTIETVVERVRYLLAPNAMALLLYNDASGTWSVGNTVGVRLPSSLRTSDLPESVRDAATGIDTLLVPELRSMGVSPVSACGMYAPLMARDQLIGVLAVERVVPNAYFERDRELLAGVAEQAAVAIDNARWFGRLRRTGAQEERMRIARDLHDRVGQALAYTAFELDRISRGADDTVRAELQTLRSDTRQILSEVRETLSDLRADVTEERDLIETVEAYLARVRQRSELDIAFEYGGNQRLPLPVEREVWRITQEAVTNVERHARASHVDVRWTCDNDGAVLEVVDDGKGMQVDGMSAPGACGLVGMRERAEAIGAALEIDSELGKGTLVRCKIGVA